ncbi:MULTISPECIES: hypothetical protein [unclassified Nocardioides]|uniref:hypothetical protein n=1 Tax=unclassified Nocardioides TaxID=2615069 RepID=UPI0012E372CD|nr:MULTISPECIES: hypothetical protein [unclassified Nocardioides]
MDTWPPVAAAAALLVAGVGYLLLDTLLNVAGDAATRSAKESAFRRPSSAARRGHHRVLMKSGYVSAVLALLAALLWLAVATNGRSDHAADARMFAWAVLGLATLAGVLLTRWWRLAGRHLGGYTPRS